MDKWNNNGFKKITKMTDKRQSKLKKRLTEPEFDFDKILEKINIVKNSKFIKSSNWFGFDWIIQNDNNYIKLLDGNYDPEGIKQNKPLRNFGGETI